MKSPDQPFNDGIKKILLKDYSGAIEDFTEAIEMDPQISSAYNNRGFAKQKLNDYSGAIADFTAVLGMDENDETALLNRGIANTKIKDYSGAISDLTRFIAHNPDNALAYYYRAIAKENISGSKFEYYIDAKADIFKAMEINPSFMISENNDSVDYKIINDLIVTIKRCNALENNPWALDDAFEIAALRELAEDYTGAIADYSKIISIHYSNAEAYKKRGHIKGTRIRICDGIL